METTKVQYVFVIKLWWFYLRASNFSVSPRAARNSWQPGSLQSCTLIDTWMGASEKSCSLSPDCSCTSTWWSFGVGNRGIQWEQSKPDTRRSSVSQRWCGEWFHSKQKKKKKWYRTHIAKSFPNRMIFFSILVSALTLLKSQFHKSLSDVRTADLPFLPCF